MIWLPRGTHGVALSRGLVLHDVARDCAGGARERTRQVHQAGTAAAREVAVLRADHKLVGTRRSPRPGINARPATGLDYVRSGLLENFQVAFPRAIFARLLRPELDVEPAALRHSPSLLQGGVQHFGVHVHVFILAGGAGSAIRDLHRDWGVEFAHKPAI